MKRINHPGPARRTLRSGITLAAAIVLFVTAGGVSAVAANAGSPAAASLAGDRTSTTENLNRGLISMRTGKGNFLSWRLLKSDLPGTAFNVYRGATRVNPTPITSGTDFTDAGAPANPVNVNFTIGRYSALVGSWSFMRGYAP